MILSKILKIYHLTGWQTCIINGVINVAIDGDGGKWRWRVSGGISILFAEWRRRLRFGRTEDIHFLLILAPIPNEQGSCWTCHKTHFLKCANEHKMALRRWDNASLKFTSDVSVPRYNSVWICLDHKGRHVDTLQLIIVFPSCLRYIGNIQLRTVVKLIRLASPYPIIRSE